MINDVLTTIKKHNLIDKGNCILVGLSGGPDSVCLLHVLCTLREKLHLTVCAVHVNHMLRGKEAELDENYAIELCKSLEVPLSVERSDINAIAKVKKISIEETGREERYELFRKYAVSFKADKIAVAHNKNDQAETVLMNLIRGTGLLGLKGIDYKRENIIRPLLDIGREQIEEYCRDNFLKPRIDSSNLENIYRRNKIRLELIPSINALFNTNIVESINRMSGIVKEDLDYLDSCILLSYEDCCKESCNNDGSSCNEIIVDVGKFNLNHLAIRKGIVRHAIKELKGGCRNISADHVESVVGLASEGMTGSVLQLPYKLTVRKSYNTLIFCIDESSLKDKVQSSRKEECELKDGLETEVITAEFYNNENKKLHATAFEQFFDYDSLKQGITIRYRCNGDIFKPYKSNGTRKLKEFFIDEKIPRDIRDKIPLIAIEKEIVWIIGYKISDKYKVNENTKYIMRIKYNLGGQNAEGH